MVGRIIAIIALSSILALVNGIHGPSYANIVLERNDVNGKQIERIYPIASLINNQSTNEQVLTALKSQLENSDPFKIKGLDKDRITLNLSSREDISSKHVNANNVDSKNVDSKNVDSKNVDSKDLKSTSNDNQCKSDNCSKKSKPTKDDIPFELPTIPFP